VLENGAFHPGNLLNNIVIILYTNTHGRNEIKA